MLTVYSALLQQLSKPRWEKLAYGNIHDSRVIVFRQIVFA
jgi:hypothetical protein